VTARKELQSARRLALGTPVVAYWTARAQLLGMHAELHAADALPARATAPRRDTILIGGAMTQSQEEKDGDEILDDAGSRFPRRSPCRSYTQGPTWGMPPFPLNLLILTK
jgi:hypothetical protein